MATTYLTRTFSSGNTKTWTWSGWVKKNKTESFLIATKSGMPFLLVLINLMT